LPGYAPLDLVGLRMTLVRSRLALGDTPRAREALAAVRAEVATLETPPPAVVRELDAIARTLDR
jgi:hypothetical protein